MDKLRKSFLLNTLSNSPSWMSFSLWFHCLAQICRWISRRILWVFTAQQKSTGHFKLGFGFGFCHPCTDKNW